MLVETGAQRPPFFVVQAGNLEVLRPSETKGEEPVAMRPPGQFTGQVNMLSGRRGLVRVRATAASEVIHVDHDELLALVQTDSELSEILMRAFILRRVELIACARPASPTRCRGISSGASRTTRSSRCTPEDLAAARWPLPPHLLEASLPGVFAVGDVRGGNVKRVASAVGGGRSPSRSSTRS